MPIQGRSRTGIINLQVGGGIVVDDVPQETDLPIATYGLNVRYRDGFVEKTEGYDAVLTAPAAAALHVASYKNSGINYWIHATATGIYADNQTTQTNITGTALTGSSVDKFTSCDLNGVFVINNQVDVPQQWGGTGTCAALDAWPTNWRCKAIRAFKYYLIAPGITQDGVFYGNLVRWSSPAEPGAVPTTWDYTDPTQDAGEVPLGGNEGDLVDGLPLGETFILYRERGAWAMQYANGADSIFKFFPISGTTGILSQNCVVDTPVGHVVLTPGPDVVTHYATAEKSILKGKWQKWLKDNLDTNNYKNSFLFHNAPKYEVWICIPTTGSTYCNRAIVWNYSEDTLSLVEIPNLTHASLGLYQGTDIGWEDAEDTWEDDEAPWDSFDVSPRVIASSGDSQLYLMDEGDNFNGTEISATWERTGLTFGDPEIYKTINGLTPRFNGDAGTSLLIQGAQASDAEGSYTWNSGSSYTLGTTRKADFIISGRFLGVRISSTGAGRWRTKSIGLNVKPAGDF